MNNNNEYLVTWVYQTLQISPTEIVIALIQYAT